MYRYCLYLKTEKKTSYISDIIFYVPCVGDNVVILVLWFVSYRAYHVGDNIWDLPQGRQFMHISVGLDSAQYQIVNIESMAAYMPIVVLSWSLLVLGRPKEADNPSFIKLTESVLVCYSNLSST